MPPPAVVLLPPEAVPLASSRPLQGLAGLRVQCHPRPVRREPPEAWPPDPAKVSGVDPQRRRAQSFSDLLGVGRRHLDVLEDEAEAPRCHQPPDLGHELHRLKEQPAAGAVVAWPVGDAGEVLARCCAFATAVAARSVSQANMAAGRPTRSQTSQKRAAPTPSNTDSTMTSSPLGFRWVSLGRLGAGSGTPSCAGGTDGAPRCF